jgi:hypothetical protein
MKADRLSMQTIDDRVIRGAKRAQHVEIQLAQLFRFGDRALHQFGKNTEDCFHKQMIRCNKRGEIAMRFHCLHSSTGDEDVIILVHPFRSGVFPSAEMMPTCGGGEVRRHGMQAVVSEPILHAFASKIDSLKPKKTI